MIHVMLIADLADPFAGGLVLDIARLARIASAGRLGSIMGVFAMGLFLSEEKGDACVQRRGGATPTCVLPSVNWITCCRNALWTSLTANQFPRPRPPRPSTSVSY